MLRSWETAGRGRSARRVPLRAGRGLSTVSYLEGRGWMSEGSVGILLGLLLSFVSSYVSFFVAFYWFLFGLLFDGEF